jgi:hypothetical protein
MMDANQRWDVGYAIEHMKQLAQVASRKNSRTKKEKADDVVLRSQTPHPFICCRDLSSISVVCLPAR